MAGLLLGGVGMWLASAAAQNGHVVTWYQWVFGIAGVLLAAAGTELSLKLRAEREGKAAKWSLLLLGAPGLVLLAISVILVIL